MPFLFAERISEERGTMAAFDRVCSGIPQMDQVFDNIRLGDNVVWRVSELSEFKLLMEPYIRQAILFSVNYLIYMLYLKSILIPGFMRYLKWEKEIEHL